MDFFNKYTSATVQGFGSQSVFSTENAETIYQSRTYFKINVDTDELSILYSNTVDSSMSYEDRVQKNYKVEDWYVDELKVGLVKECKDDMPTSPEITVNATVNGEVSWIMKSGEMINTDPIFLSAKKGDYICLELSYHGKEMQCHPERNYPTFANVNGQWLNSNAIPVPAMIGCVRNEVPKICFWGDSITQGIGTANNSYTHYAAVVAEILGNKYSYWDIGLGCARAADAATEGVWFEKAKHSDLVLVCMGINDLYNGHSVKETIENLQHIIDILKANNCKVLLQTVPPFSMMGDYNKMWWEVNDALINTLAPKCDAFFNNIPILGKPESVDMAAYGDHPDATGHRLWGEALAPVIDSLLS